MQSETWAKMVFHTSPIAFRPYSKPKVESRSWLPKHHVGNEKNTPYNLLNAFQGTLALQTPQAVGLYSWALIWVLGQSYWGNRPFHLLELGPQSYILYSNLSSPTVFIQILKKNPNSSSFFSKIVSFNSYFLHILTIPNRNIFLWNFYATHYMVVRKIIHMYLWHFNKSCDLLK